MNIGLIGIGTVGGGTYQVLKENAEEISNKSGIEIKITHVADKNLKLAKETVDKETIIEEDAFSLIENSSIDTIIELIGGTGIALDIVRKALENGKPRPRIKKWKQVETVLGDYLQLALVGQMPAAQALKLADTDIKRALRKK